MPLSAVQTIFTFYPICNSILLSQLYIIMYSGAALEFVCGVSSLLSYLLQPYWAIRVAARNTKNYVKLAYDKKSNVGNF